LQRVTLAVLLGGEQLGRGIGLEIVQRGDGLRAVSKRRMAGHAVDAFRADIDHPTVAHALSFAARRQHRFPPPIVIGRLGTSCACLATSSAHARIRARAE
jgi:hypothetical protein